MKPARMTPAASRKRKAAAALKKAQFGSALAYYQHRARVEMAQDLANLRMSAMLANARQSVQRFDIPLDGPIVRTTPWRYVEAPVSLGDAVLPRSARHSAKSSRRPPGRRTVSNP